jgi:AcrR family transcriptional regulator
LGNAGDKTDRRHGMSSRRGADATAVTRDQIVDAAEALARSEGVANVTVRRLSAALSITAPALYWHLDGKSELMARLIDRVAARVERPAADTGTWLERLLRFYGSIRDVFGEYTGISTALMTQEPTEATLANCIYVVEVLMAAGFDEEGAVSLFNSLTTLSLGHLMMIDAARHQRRPPADSTYAPNATRLAELLADRPGLAEFQRSLVELDDTASRAQFLRGVDLLVRGAALSRGVGVPTTEDAAATAPVRRRAPRTRRTA